MNNSADMNDLYRDPMFNPMAQYEQAYCYYRYLCMQMDYKIKCKEYEKCAILVLIIMKEVKEELNNNSSFDFFVILYFLLLY